jgi:hypothetical protein
MQNKVTRPLSYDLEQAQNVRIETTKRNQSLFIQIFPNRKIPTEEAATPKGDSPVKKIIRALDDILPKTNAAYKGDGAYVDIHPPREHFNAFTVEVKAFYEFPIDCEYMKGKIIKALKELKL